MYATATCVTIRLTERSKLFGNDDDAMIWSTRWTRTLLFTSVIFAVSYYPRLIFSTLSIASTAYDDASQQIPPLEADPRVLRIHQAGSVPPTEDNLTVTTDEVATANDETSVVPENKTQYWNQGVKNGTIYLCGFNRGRLVHLLFPELTQESWIHFKSRGDANALLFLGVSGPCPRHTGRMTITHTWVRKKWRGKTLFMLGEPNVREGESDVLIAKRGYAIGSVRDGKKAVYVTFLAMAFVGSYDVQQQWPQLFDHAYKPISSRTYFAIYAASNCVDYREAAVDRLADIGIVHQGGGCGGQNGTRLVNQRRRQSVMRGSGADAAWTYNQVIFSRYRFCLVMENSYWWGYITEKILNAFLGGCLPIYYGTDEVFEMFNHRAFIYYNISDPEPALDRIRYLESNHTALEEVLRNEPILADGDKTIERYFSLSDDIGNGTLKRRIREMLDMSPY